MSDDATAAPNKSTAMWILDTVVGCVEYVGAGVATFLGLNESQFQYVIDQMSEEDWKVAREVHARRELENSYRQSVHLDSNEIEVIESQPIANDA